MSKKWTVAEISTKTGISPYTLRYYENIGLIDDVERNDSGHRRYGESDLLRIEFLKRLRATGMPVSEMQHYVTLFRMGDATLRERRHMLEAHREDIIQQIVALKDTLDFIDMKIARYTREEAAINSN